MASTSTINVQENEAEVNMQEKPGMQHMQTNDIEEKASILQQLEEAEEESEEVPEPTFEETIDWYFKEKFQVQQKKLIKFEKQEQAAREKPSRKSKYTWKKMWAYRKRKNIASEEEEDSSDDEHLDYDNFHLSFDPEKSPKFNC